MKDHDIVTETEELQEKVDLYEKRMQKKKKIIGLSDMKNVTKPLKWHYLL